MIKLRTLKCGVRVVMDQTNYLQSASIGFWIRTGSVDEDKKYAGISHFVEHMMFKGTEHRTAKEIAADIDKTGGQINAFTSKEATCYYVKTLSANLISSTEVLIDMLVNSKFDKKEMSRERKVIVEEIKMIQDAPDEDAHEMINKIIYKGSPLGNSIAGTESSLKNISQNVMREYVKNEYTRDNIVVAITGNFDEDEICGYLEDKLISLGESKVKKEHEILPYEPGFKVKAKDIEQTHFFIGVPSIDLFDKRHYAMTVLSNIMGGSMSSRLFQAVREQKGLAYSVYCVHSASTMGGSFMIYAGVSHDNVGEAIEAIKEELEILKRDGVTLEELNKAKEQLKSSFIFGQENVATKMFSIGKAITLVGKAKTDKEVLELIDAITLEDLDEVSKIITNIKNYSGASVSNKKFNLKKMVLGEKND
ncbi:MAG: pitrilysin family protein [Anaerovoracaceae bacterium]